MNYQKQWIDRNDSVPGYIYWLEAENFGGWLPGKLLRRCKIGLSKNPQKRLDDFHSNQPPCNLKVIRIIWVEDMATVESELHRQFKGCNVKLHRSREWFDFTPLQFLECHLAFNRYEPQHTIKVAPRLIVGVLVGLMGVGLLLHSGSSIPPAASPSPKPAATYSTKKLAVPVRKISRNRE